MADFLNKQQCLFGRNHRLNRQRGHDSVEFRQRMNAAGRILFISGSEALDTGRMVNMPAPKRCDQNGSIEELPHRKTLFCHLAKAVLPFAIDKVCDRGVCGFPVIDPDAEFLFESDTLADRTQRDALALGFELKSIPWSKLQPVPKTLGKNYTPCFVNRDFVIHNAIMVWHKPHVNGATVPLGGIRESNEA